MLCLKGAAPHLSSSSMKMPRSGVCKATYNMGDLLTMQNFIEDEFCIL